MQDLEPHLCCPFMNLNEICKKPKSVCNLCTDSVGSPNRCYGNLQEFCWSAGTHTETKAHTLCSSGKFFLLSRLLLPDCFHHRAIGLFLPCCSVQAKLFMTLMLLTIEKTHCLSSNALYSKTYPQSNTLHPTPFFSSNNSIFSR